MIFIVSLINQFVELVLLSQHEQPHRIELQVRNLRSEDEHPWPQVRVAHVLPQWLQEEEDNNPVQEAHLRQL
jgi:hypothetical protein